MNRLFPVLLSVAVAALLSGSAAYASDVAGEWDWVNYTEGGERPMTVSFQQNGETVTGKWDTADLKGTFSGDTLKLSFPFTSREGGMTGTLTIEGKLSGEVLKGKWMFDQYSGTFTATRRKKPA